MSARLTKELESTHGDQENSQVGSVLDHAWLKQRADNFKIDVVGRLEWIEDMAEMIRHARNDYFLQNPKRKSS